MPGFHPVALFFLWLFFGGPIGAIAGAAMGGFVFQGMSAAVGALGGLVIVGGGIAVLIYMVKMNQRIVDDMVVNMVDVGEETGELDTMLYKIADTYDDEVAVLTESLMSLMEPLLIMVLGGIVGFIVIALFMPLISLITKLA